MLMAMTLKPFNSLRISHCVCISKNGLLSMSSVLNNQQQSSKGFVEKHLLYRFYFTDFTFKSIANSSINVFIELYHVILLTKLSLSFNNL